MFLGVRHKFLPQEHLLIQAVKFLYLCSQIHVTACSLSSCADYWRTDEHWWSQSVNKPNTTYKLSRVWYMTEEFCSEQECRRYCDGSISLCKGCHLLIKVFLGWAWGLHLSWDLSDHFCSLLGNFSRTSQIWKCAVIDLRFWPLVSAKLMFVGEDYVTSKKMQVISI